MILCTLFLLSGISAPALAVGEGGLEEMAYHSSGRRLFVDFRLPVSRIKEMNLKKLLEEKSFEVECSICIKVVELGSKKTTENWYEKSIRYSRFEGEYLLSDKMLKRDYISSDYYEMVEMFISFENLPVVNLGFLDRSEGYEVRVRAEVTSGLASRGSGEESRNAGIPIFNQAVSLFNKTRKAVSALSGGGDSFTIETEPQEFSADALPLPYIPSREEGEESSG